jgi:hypothetical protein
LNIYNFRRIGSGKLSCAQNGLGMRTFSHIEMQCNLGLDKNAYHHEKFLRGLPALAREIPRESIKGSGPRRCARSLGNNPNLYEMPFLREDGASTSAQSSLSTSSIPLIDQAELSHANILRTENEGLRTPHH